MDGSIKFFKKKILVYIILLLIEFLAFALSISLEFYLKYAGRTSETIDIFAFIFWILGWILILPIVRLTPAKKGNLKGILIIVLSIFIGLAAYDQKPKLLYTYDQGGNHLVIGKGKDILGYYVRLDIPSPSNEQENKVYCSKQDYDGMLVDEIYNTDFFMNPYINWGRLSEYSEHSDH